LWPLLSLHHTAHYPYIKNCKYANCVCTFAAINEAAWMCPKFLRCPKRPTSLELARRLLRHGRVTAVWLFALAARAASYCSIAGASSETAQNSQPVKLCGSERRTVAIRRLCMMGAGFPVVVSSLNM